MAVEVKKELVPVVKGDIQLGVPLPYSVFDRSGILLLRRGFQINLQKHLDVLQLNGLYHEERFSIQADRPRDPGSPLVPAESQSTFEMVEMIKLRFGRLLENFKSGKLHGEFIARVEEIGISLQEACTHDTDAVVACLHLAYQMPYEVVHHVKVAVLCELIGKRLGVGEETRLTLIKSALTHDLGLIDIQDDLDRQTSPLTPGQQKRIREHPADGAMRLRQLGVVDPVWLDAVRHHHERLDGSGYPDGLVGDAIKIPTRVLAVADNYAAMVRDRPYRKAMLTRSAMRELMTDDGGKNDRRLIEAMIKEVGVFPPGALVKLASGEVAVVKSKGSNSAQPEIYALIKLDGMPMLTPARRDASRPEHAIQGVLPFSPYRGSLSLIRSLWMQE